MTTSEATLLPFNFRSIVQHMAELFETLPDTRRGANSRYQIKDAAMSALGVFFTQCPSFLEFQRRMQDAQGCNNAQTLFGAFAIPSDNQIRNLLDPISPATVATLFDQWAQALYRQGHLDGHRHMDALLLALDGTEYFHSTHIHCDNCSTKVKAGTTHYHHTALTPVLVAPGQHRIVPLAPEFIYPQDGVEKQDCELRAAGRWLDRWGTHYAPWRIIVLGDDLYAHQPFCQHLLDIGFGFILTCKPTSHLALYEWVDELERLGKVSTLQRRYWTGKTHRTETYRFLNGVPLRGTADALDVNWCELVSTSASGKVLFRNDWITPVPISRENVAEIALAGRARWKIENENNNALKHGGYHFEHNYGHGKNHLASLLATLILLAFALHSVLDWIDLRYRTLRQKGLARMAFFSDLRTLLNYQCFSSWDQFMAFMRNPGQDPPDAKLRSY